jgi:hypothetical protein
MSERYREYLNTKTPDDFKIKSSGVLCVNRSISLLQSFPLGGFGQCCREGRKRLLRFRHQDAQEIVFVQIGLGYFLDVLRG